jgi:trimeric autotransporter adhesin
MIVMILSALRPFSAARIRVVLTGGIAVILCVTWGCSGFFINPTLSSIYVTPASSTVAVNSTVQLSATGSYSDGSQKPISGETVSWSSSDTTVATITSPGGLVTGVASGTASITVSAQGVTGTATVSVSPQNVTTLAITTTQGSTTPQNTATISGTPGSLQFYAYANMSASQDVTTAVTWTSSNTSVATIGSGASGSAGLLSATAAGTTNVTATITNTTTGQLITSNTCVVTVQ